MHLTVAKAAASKADLESADQAGMSVRQLLKGTQIFVAATAREGGNRLEWLHRSWT